MKPNRLRRTHSSCSSPSLGDSHVPTMLPLFKRHVLRRQTSTMTATDGADRPAQSQSAGVARNITLETARNQLQSPLFGTLFPELRNAIFVLVLAEHDDTSRPYSKHEYFYRPGVQFARKTDTNLLLTCRLIYSETHLLPIILREHVFWMHRGPPRSIAHHDFGHNIYFDRLTAEQRAAVCNVRFFTQLLWLESRKSQRWATHLAIRKLTIVVRHSDWWFWENEEHLRIQSPQEGWASWIESIPGLEELQLEFETIEPKTEQLEERVRVALGWEFPLSDGTMLIHDGESPVKSTWMGTSRLTPGFGWGAWDADLQGQLEEETLDGRFPLTLNMHVRKFRFVRRKQSQ
ncbi:hypothetical protein R3P38DRAFT_2880584 [Favolaschia claudopus]|uniref:Uncharacterized protein n=1 Tax=Favolaschia claudopus TaxID=2862362 RepID=A0AAW0D027_9AGAR